MVIHYHLVSIVDDVILSRYFLIFGAAYLGISNLLTTFPHENGGMQMMMMMILWRNE